MEEAVAPDPEWSTACRICFRASKGAQSLQRVDPAVQAVLFHIINQDTSDRIHLHIFVLPYAGGENRRSRPPAGFPVFGIRLARWKITGRICDKIFVAPASDRLPPEARSNARSKAIRLLTRDSLRITAADDVQISSRLPSL